MREFCLKNHWFPFKVSLSSQLQSGSLLLRATNSDTTYVFLFLEKGERDILKIISFFFFSFKFKKENKKE